MWQITNPGRPQQSFDNFHSKDFWLYSKEKTEGSDLLAHLSFSMNVHLKEKEAFELSD